jgi:hypothetical protein
MAFGDSDLAVFTADFGVTVEFGGSSANGIFDQPTDTKLADMGFGGLEVTAPAVRLPYTAFTPMPTEGDTVTVNGTDYVVAEKHADVDGAFIRYCLKATS